ncbi:MAG TPA: hypothetical protein VN669_12305 [Candidatus Acidoferrales bacterium]|nr:hypothetical protein [Candidatus Acidoferrales bacterium]
MEQQEKQGASPLWYRNTAIIFFAIAAVLAAAGLRKHDWVYWAFAGITFLNAIMTTLKFITIRESGK